jgi:hypothetical protein
MEKINKLGTTLTSLATEARCVLQFASEVNVVPSSPILFTLKIEAILVSETTVLTTPTHRHIPQDGILHSHSPESLKSYITLTGWTL